jgi:hypothetical protein
MQCCPLSSYDDAEPCEFYNVKTVTARKSHKCCECFEDIPPMAKYEYSTGCWGGDFQVFKTCLSCKEIRDHFACDGFSFGTLWEDLRENFFPTMRAGGPCLEGLSPETKGRLFDLRMKWLEERDN